ncbi:hypothetical protein JTB14_012770 [Gonioctena quinquepunctata]|nr:hypothetical protein JTB14_012770 [Gonioctena quinquepunctata]
MVSIAPLNICVLPACEKVVVLTLDRLYSFGPFYSYMRVDDIDFQLILEGPRRKVIGCGDDSREAQSGIVDLSSQLLTPAVCFDSQFVEGLPFQAQSQFIAKEYSYKLWPSYE